MDMDGAVTSKTLFWSAQLLNAVVLTSNMPGWAKLIVMVLGVLLTVVSLINQSITLYKTANSWHITIVVKQYFKRKKRKG